MRPRSLTLSLVLILATICAGLAIRFAHLGLPLVVSKYGGSVLWALMLYWIVSTVLSKWSLSRVALLTGLIATGVEFFKLYHSPSMDAFRLTLPGVLILGRFFSYWDILAYWAAILLGVVLDRSLRRST